MTCHLRRRVTRMTVVVTIQISSAWSSTQTMSRITVCKLSKTNHRSRLLRLRRVNTLQRRTFRRQKSIYSGGAARTYIDGCCECMSAMYTAVLGQRRHVEWYQSREAICSAQAEGDKAKQTKPESRSKGIQEWWKVPSVEGEAQNWRRNRRKPEGEVKKIYFFIFIFNQFIFRHTVPRTSLVVAANHYIYERILY
jgi:hypothetical protein